MENKDRHFELLFWFCAALCFLGLALVTAMIYIPVPVENQRYADIILGSILTTIVVAPVSYLLGGSIPLKKQQHAAGTTTVEANITASTTEGENTNGN